MHVRYISLFVFLPWSFPSVLPVILTQLFYSWLSSITAGGFSLDFKGSISSTQHCSSAQLWSHHCAEQSTAVQLYLKELPFLSHQVWAGVIPHFLGIWGNFTEIQGSSNAVVRSSKTRQCIFEEQIVWYLFKGVRFSHLNYTFLWQPLVKGADERKCCHIELAGKQRGWRHFQVSLLLRNSFMLKGWFH